MKLFPFSPHAVTQRSILVVLGTRPDAIKLAPVVLALRRHSDLRVRILTTAQHRDMVEPMLAAFGLAPDLDLDVMTHGQGPSTVAARVLERLDPILAAAPPSWLVVLGDTTTALAAALAAFHRRVPVAHVEAGLRSGVADNPFPEEMNRRAIAQIARLHFAPTERNRAHLLREGIEPEQIEVTGNTVIDAVEIIVGAAPPLPPVVAGVLARGSRLLVLTAHRRENHGAPLRSIYRAARRIVERYGDVEVVAPIHPNPNVVETAAEVLGDHPRLHRVEPLFYPPFLASLASATLVLTDSGGLQEELPALGVPVLVLRTTTERPELIESGGGILVGVDEEKIVAETCGLLENADRLGAMAQRRYPFGEGGAAQRIAEHLANR